MRDGYSVRAVVNKITAFIAIVIRFQRARADNDGVFKPLRGVNAHYFYGVFIVVSDSKLFDGFVDTRQKLVHRLLFAACGMDKRVYPVHFKLAHARREQADVNLLFADYHGQQFVARHKLRHQPDFSHIFVEFFKFFGKIIGLFANVYPVRVHKTALRRKLSYCEQLGVAYPSDRTFKHRGKRNIQIEAPYQL